MFNLTNTQHRITSPYHPQTNGLTERFNQTLTNCLRAKINLEQNDWDIHINMCLFSYRSTEQSSIKYSPFQMMFGREPILPIDTEVLLPAKSLECEEITDKVVSDAMDSLQTFQKQMYSKAE